MNIPQLLIHWTVDGKLAVVQVLLAVDEVVMNIFESESWCTCAQASLWSVPRIGRSRFAYP